ncbi:hypothetical protein V6N13_110421 [Hibiscus sabdariffa]
MSQLETTGPALADYLGWDQISAERLAELLAYNKDIEKNMLMKSRSLSILRLTAGAENSGLKLCLDEFWAFYAPSCFSTTSDYQDTVASLFFLVDHSWHES